MSAELEIRLLNGVTETTYPGYYRYCIVSTIFDWEVTEERCAARQRITFPVCDEDFDGKARVNGCLVYSSGTLIAYAPLEPQIVILARVTPQISPFIFQLGGIAPNLLRDFLAALGARAGTPTDQAVLAFELGAAEQWRTAKPVTVCGTAP